MPIGSLDPRTDHGEQLLDCCLSRDSRMSTSDGPTNEKVDWVGCWSVSDRQNLKVTLKELFVALQVGLRGYLWGSGNVRTATELTTATNISSDILLLWLYRGSSWGSAQKGMYSIAHRQLHLPPDLPPGSSPGRAGT